MFRKGQTIIPTSRVSASCKKRGGTSFTLYARVSWLLGRNMKLWDFTSHSVLTNFSLKPGLLQLFVAIKTVCTGLQASVS